MKYADDSQPRRARWAAAFSLIMLVTVRFMIFTAPPGGNLDLPGLPVEASFADLGLPQKVQVRDLWSHQDLGTMQGKISPVVPWHGARLFKLSPR